MDAIEKSARGRKEKAVGIDLGLRNLMTLHTGVMINHHPSLPRLKHNLKVLTKRLEGQVPGSKRWYETLRVIDKTKRHMENCQIDYANKLAHTLTKHYRVICVEADPAKGTLSPSAENEIYIANWSLLRTILRKKCKEMGCTYVDVSPFFTSQTCSKCGNRQKIGVGVRTYDCPKCGLTLDRDINAAINLKRKGLEKLNRQRKAQAKLGQAPF